MKGGKKEKREKHAMVLYKSIPDETLYHVFQQYESLYMEYIRDKSVALVGPANSILNTKKGEIIDKFDIVVRLNKSLPLPKGLSADIGRRTDVIYNSLNTTDFPHENNLSASLYKKNNVQFMCSSYPYSNEIFRKDILHYITRYQFEIPFKVMNDTRFRQFERYLGTRPYTGTCAIMDLLSYPIKYLYITGLDFYQTKYYSEYRRITKVQLSHTRDNTIHKNKPQMDYLRTISLFDSRIILDDFLDKLLYQEYYKTVQAFRKLRIPIFQFGNVYLQKYFELNKFYYAMSTRDHLAKYSQVKKEEMVPLMIFTHHPHFHKKENEYCILITRNSHDVEYRNQIYSSKEKQKKYIANFYYKEISQDKPSIYLSKSFIDAVKQYFQKIEIKNCNIYLLLMWALVLHSEERHFFCKEEIMSEWGLTVPEKKFIFFLEKKKILHLI
jgi:hypothetical protein